MKRSELKDIVKECLVEILLEGVGGSEGRVNEQRSPSTKEQAAAPLRRPALDMIRPMGKALQERQTRPEPPRPPPAAFKELAGGNDVMASIFADTASSGLVESVGSERSSHSANPIIDTGIDPTRLEGASNWAALAFAEPRRR